MIVYNLQGFKNLEGVMNNTYLEIKKWIYSPLLLRQDAFL